MTVLDALILGLVQGLTEFIPVSSSGHLVITQHFLGVGDFTFSVLLNFGTLLALTIFYRRRLWDLCRRVLLKRDWRLAFKLIAATVPAVMAGAVLGEYVERLNYNVWLVVVMLALLGVLMIWFGRERKGELTVDTNKTTWRQALVVGVAQAFALLPGTSRSGITILAGLQQKLSARSAAEFSFLLAIPTILGASLKVLLFTQNGTEFITRHFGLFMAGNAASFLSGLLAISFLINLLSRKGLALFGYYRLVLAGALSVLLFMGVI